MAGINKVIIVGNLGNDPEIPEYLTEIKQSEFLALQGK